LLNKDKNMRDPQKILNDEIKKRRTPSVQYSIFDQTSIIKRYSFGYSDIENKLKVNKDTTYNAYSVTKTFTALAIMQLAQQAKLDIENPIKDYLPDFPYNPSVNIKQVLSHTAGIPNPIPLAWIHLPVENKEFSRDDFFKRIIAKNKKNVSKPNEKFSYSNLGYVLLGQLIEKVSGLKYEEYIQNNIIKPLGMPVSEMGFEIYDSSRHAKGYHKKSSIFNLILGFLIDKSKFMDRSGPVWRPFKPFYVNGSSYGGLIGTQDSFIKYIQELLNPDCKLISPDHKKIMFTENHTNNGKPTKMCLSWFKGELNGNKFFTHAGGGGGYYCEIRIYPDIGIGSVVFFNRTGMNDQRFLDKVDKFYIKKRDR
jgi:D-alanyl-D-alanine carboxypeptidase